MSSNSISLNSLRDRVKNHVITKQAAASAATDPAEKGSATATKDPMLSDEKSKLPPSKENESNEGKKLEDKELQPSSTGKNLPISPKDGNAEDKKGVEKMASIRTRIQKLLKKEATEPEVKAPVSKSAGEADAPVTLTPDSLYKLAAAIFETEDGIDAILPVLRKKAGQDAAIELMKAAASEYQRASEEAFYLQELQKQADEQAYAHEAHMKEIVKSASSKEEASALMKAATVHYENTVNLNEFEKMAYAQGPEDAAAMMGAPEGAEPQIEGAQEPTLEQIAQLIQLAVQNQEITPEDGEAMLQELVSAVEGGGAGGEMPPGGEGEMPPGAEGEIPPGGEGEMPPEAPAEETTKEASAASRALFAKLRKK